MHVDSIEDANLLDSSDPEDDDQVNANDSESKTTASNVDGTRRKPLPPNPQLFLGDRSKPPPKTYPSFHVPDYGSNGTVQVERKPVGRQNKPGHRSLDAAPPLPSRGLLGPRPINARLYSVDSPVLQNASDKQNINLRRWSEQPSSTPPPLPLRPSLEDTKHISGLHFEGASNTLAAPKKGKGQPFPGKVDAREDVAGTQGTSLSLIRRYNGLQWNVGKIMNKADSNVWGRPTDAVEGLSIRIMTPGYSRFPAGSAEHAHDTNHDNKRLSQTFRGQETRESDCLVYPAFERYLSIPSKHRRAENRLSMDRLDLNNDGGSEMSNEYRRSSRQSSIDLGPPGSSHSNYPANSSPSSKGFSFQSPWEGICEFSTGVAGRSLKCNYRYNIWETKPGLGPQSASVSELRFNLPSSKTFGSPAPKSPLPGIPRESKRSSFFSHQHRRQHSSSYEAQERVAFSPKAEFQDRLDLSIGQEHAGGGFGGKQAKLGKLIIEKEGLQMLDLVVAANMALWWKVYERIL